ncbi:MaoC family dehydratase N-terminal domain-containing protein [Acaricomes phytoseiuli]|uniref:MaoC family dehydratase N-terminal domain-containing protein n=1 Tax=Acaricomes phytoseiuli TaxID=291968 RepID=UPI002222BF5B|nr:MaoC family dehydratase N-terminal domain-containing protein [Acaricomes phytoseiuli]MCW1249734.1 MaoC family dehydratase N-terminal domain-containing protein [Acaricomes phytoseiuli]
MSLHPGLAGRVYPAEGVYDVGREKIREFAAAVKAVDPVHTDLEAARAAGYSDLVAPPTFAIIVAQRAEARFIRDPEAGIDFSRVVHGEQRFQHHRPIIAGDALQAELHVDSIRMMGAGAMLTTRAEITTVEGEPVSTTVSTIVVRTEKEGQEPGQGSGA